MITCDGKAGRELSRRIGEGRRTFELISKAWTNAGISRARKVHIYMTCVVSKLLYSLETLWLLKAERAKLDAFHHRCLRKIVGIPPSFVSRVPNSVVLQVAAAPLLSELLAHRQTTAYQKLTAQSQDSLGRRLVCTAEGQPIQWSHTRRRGRPRQRWAHCVFEMTRR